MSGWSWQLISRHSNYQLSKIDDCPSLEYDFTLLIQSQRLSCQTGSFKISLLLLKQLDDFSDDQVVERWVEKPYWQFLSGEDELQWSAPVASSPWRFNPNRDPYDVHTIVVVLKQLKRITGTQPEILNADHGYRVEKILGKIIS